MITPQLSPEALDALRNATVTESSVTLPSGRLERWAWQQVVAALTLIGGGGAWRKADRRFVFPRDPRPELVSFLALQTGQGPGNLDDVDRTDDSALVPASVLLELADRLDTLAWTRPLEGEGQRPSWCWRVAADTVRSTVVNGQVQPAGWVVARREENGQLVDDADGEIHDTREAAEKTLRMVRINGWHGHRIYALVEVPDAR